MARNTTDQKDVRELQRIALGANEVVKRPKPKSLSRAAYLELVDILSRWSAAGIALIAGMGAYLAITTGRDFPVRAATWTLLLLAALWASRRLCSEFRRGAAITARPFRWRASYTSAVSVLGVIFASAPILLIPTESASAFAFLLSGLVMIGAFGSAAFHAAHLPSAAAFALPGAVFPVIGALRVGEVWTAVAISIVSLIAVGIVAAANKVIKDRSAGRNPRTTFLRREVSPVEDALERATAPDQSLKSAVSGN